MLDIKLGNIYKLIIMFAIDRYCSSFEVDGLSLLEIFSGMGCLNFDVMTAKEEIAFRELEKLREDLIKCITDGIFKTQEDFKENQINTCLYMLIKAASTIPKKIMTAKKALKRYIQGFQLEKRGIKLRGGFRNKEEEHVFQREADKRIEEINQSLIYLVCYPTHGGSGKTQTLLRRIYQVFRYCLDIDVMNLKIGLINRIFDILKPLAGLDNYPDVQTIRKHLSKESRKKIDEQLELYRKERAAELQEQHGGQQEISFVSDRQPRS